MRPSIFVSYSHTDAHLVGPVVALLRASEAAVFRDADSLKPGKKWREQLEGALGSAQTVLVFWCRHAASSKKVRREYLAAIELRKDVLPVLVDATPLPAELAEYQYIDFQGAFRGGHAANTFAPAAAPPARTPAAAVPARATSLAMACVGLIVIAAAGAGYWLLGAPRGSSDPTTRAASPLVWFGGLLAGAMILLAIVRARRRHARAHDAATRAAAVATAEQRRLATTIAAELDRRRGSGTA